MALAREVSSRTDHADARLLAVRRQPPEYSCRAPLLPAGARGYLTEPIEVDQFYVLLDELMAKK